MLTRRSLTLLALLTHAVAATIAYAGPIDSVEADSLTDGPVSKLAFMVGDYVVHETKYAPDGSIAAEEEGGVIQIRPALAGNYVMLVGAEEGDNDVSLWLITWHDSDEEYIGTVISSSDPDVGTFRGGLDGDRLALTSDTFELPDGRVLQFRVTLENQENGDLVATVERAMDDEWFTATRSMWVRQDGE